MLPEHIIKSVARKLKFIGCEIIYREACYLAATSASRVDVQFLRKGLHDLETATMRDYIQKAIDEVSEADGYEAIILGYARCNDGLVGIEARKIPLVIPRAHDCITFFFGSRQAYQNYFDQHPGTYYLTTGWSERNVAGDYSRPAYGQQGVMDKLGLAKTKAELIAQYGEDNADYIAELMGDWTANYSQMTYVQMGVGDERPLIEQGKAEAARRGWTFDQRDGDWTLLRKLFDGPWDDDFVVIPPGYRLITRNDQRVLDAEKVQGL